MLPISVIFWIAAAVILLIAEALTAQLVTIWFAIGAVVSALVSVAAPENILLQITVFVVVSGAFLAITKPFVKKTMASKVSATNADRVIGAEGLVTVKIDPINGGGQIKVMGQEWSAVSESDSVIEVGEKVKVLKISGVKAVVCRTSERNSDLKDEIIKF